MSLEKILWLGKVEARKIRGQQRMRWLNVINDSLDMSFTKLQETVKDKGASALQFRGMQRVRHGLAIKEQQREI